MAEAPSETLLLVEHRYVCSECSHLAASLEDALLHQQCHHHHHGSHRYQIVGFSSGDFQALSVPESNNQYQCLECGQLLVSPGQLLEHQELHIKLLGQEPEPAPVGKVGGVGTGQIHYECVECKALFSSQEVWLAHRQSHRAEPAAAAQGQNQALVDLEHSYQKLEEEEEEEEEGGGDGTVQLLLYECGECLQLFQTPKDFLEHQAAHLTPLNGAANEAPADCKVKEDVKEEVVVLPPPPPPP
ncbi:ZN574 protein, partial [Crotophaga sulcirostris]|nr:ZN574 protein [Crotophaga sulcirostris]